MYPTNELEEDWILLSEPTIHSPTTNAPGFFVARTVRWRWQVHSVPHSMYLHQDGFWYETTYSNAGPTGYFATRKDAEDVLRMSEDPERDNRIVAQVCREIIEAEVVIVRKGKREFQT